LVVGLLESYCFSYSPTYNHDDGCDDHHPSSSCSMTSLLLPFDRCQTACAPVKQEQEACSVFQRLLNRSDRLFVALNSLCLVPRTGGRGGASNRSKRQPLAPVRGAKKPPSCACSRGTKQTA
jgi:hypothetical protein